MKTPDRARILLALDACSDVSASLAEVVTTLASRLDAELEGLFVEDAQLLQAAGLSFVREIGPAGTERSFTVEDLRRLNRETSHDAERLLARVAGERRIPWRFGTAEGLRMPAAMAASRHCDLFVPARRTRGGGVGSRSAAAVLQRVSVVVADGADTARALSVVHALVRNGHTREVLLLGESPPSDALLSTLSREPLRTYAQRVSLEEPAHAISAAREYGAGLLIAPRSLLAPGTVSLDLDELPVATLLLR